MYAAFIYNKLSTLNSAVTARPSYRCATQCPAPGAKDIGTRSHWLYVKRMQHLSALRPVPSRETGCKYLCKLIGVKSTWSDADVNDGE